jgi:hypothetical protein
VAVPAPPPEVLVSVLVSVLVVMTPVSELVALPDVSVPVSVAVCVLVSVAELSPADGDDADEDPLLIALALLVAAVFGPTVPPNTPPEGEVALPALRASAAYASKVKSPEPAGLITATMPFLQCWPVFCEQ